VLVMLSAAAAAPGRRDELVAAARTVATATRADRGCLTYSFSVDVEDPDRVLGVEVWSDRAALDEHMCHHHTQEFLAVVAELITGEPAMAFHDVPDEDDSPALPGAPD
jgi:quinol monooxygenase YgiN